MPIVQGGATTKVTVANLTAGRAVTTGILTVTSGTNAGTTEKLVLNTTDISNNMQLVVSQNGTTSHSIQSVQQGVGYRQLVLQPNGSDTSLGAGNLIQGTAAKGVNFTANTPTAGMTSQLLNWYEEGTWNPNQGGGLTVVGAFSSTGKYTRNGREVSISGTVTGATSVAVTAAGVITTNLPFTVGTTGHGGATNAAVTASATVICTSTNVTSANAIAATGTITFSATYFV